MAKSSNQKLKLIYLARILQEKTDEEHGLTMQEIIDELARYDVKAERKSIYDDVEALNILGMDVLKETAGGRTEYKLVSRTFELAELKLLVDAVQSSRFITRKKSESLIRKIEGLASTHQAKKLARNVHVANRIKTMNESIYYTVDYIHSAIYQGKKISFQYFKWNEKGEKALRRDGKVYKVSPWALTWDDENYYLVAFDSEAGIIKHYRVDKMVKLSVTDEKREGEEHFKNFDMALYSKKTFGMYSGKDEQVTLRCRNAMADPIIDRFGQDVLMRPVPGEEAFDVTVKVSVSPVFLTWVMNFGGDMKITGPQHVIDQQIELAHKTLDLYK
ncbi:MAG: WYL domain-containing protein [Firmicutes bacterium]|nr:WYL domain-containing protein [Bacillota bacterium]